ncbi:MAG: MFS transporter [Verrucomicrobiales bacterium]|nr:MFS transporter [Verrucomicrobiales bacterium]
MKTIPNAVPVPPGAPRSPATAAARPAALGILAAISLSHLLNDSIQAVLPAIYPLLKTTFQLDFVQIGFITLTFQCTASILQPVVGLVTDRHPQPFSLAWGMGLTLAGLVLLAFAHSFPMVLVAAGTIGLGSSIFHPEASRVARLASGGRHGLAQSLFQVGGNAGTALGPLLAALIVVPRGQSSVLWFGLIALAGIVVLSRVGRWYRSWVAERRATASSRPSDSSMSAPTRQVWGAMSILLALMFSKFFYLASITNFYTFYQIERFNVSIARAQISLFIFLAAVAAGTILGGPIGDRIGRKKVIWASIAGIAPFTLALPHVGFAWMIALSIVIGSIQASAFSAILVYAQELIPGRVGLVSGLFFGLAFGLAGIASALLGELADRTSIDFVFQVCAYLPLIGFLAVFLPGDRPAHS